jgi:cytochrome c oxidase assembly protein subunit 15
MPLDDQVFAVHVPAGGRAEDSFRRPARPVAIWLFAICAMLLVMIMLGGATRLTGSGLSIMEWAPLSGALPPLSHAEWERLFALYQQIPQYQLLHAGMDLDGFRQIFWLEWTHRFWGRLIGVAVLLPLLWFAATRRLSWQLVARLGLIFVLGGLQGAVGWFMVASGFSADSTAVSAYRLVMHLVLAVALYAAVLWTGLSQWHPLPAPPAKVGATRRLLQLAAVLVALTIVAGGFVAGTHAGFDYNSFPLMEGHWVPPGYGRLSPWLRNLTENIPAVQFDHRLLATLTLGCIVAVLASGLADTRDRPARLALLALAGAVCLQYALGVATLLLVVPPSLATLHQGVAMLVLTAVLVALHIYRPARGSGAGA